jgi:hypothetical protein
LRPRAAASSITSRYGSHALADGARPGIVAAESVDTSPLVAGFASPESVDTPALVAGFARAESVDTPALVAGFARAESVDTSPLVAGFGGQTRGLPPAARTATPAARR